MTVQGVSTVDAGVPGVVAVTAEVFSLEHKDREIQEIMIRLNFEAGVRSVGWKKVDHQAD